MSRGLVRQEQSVSGVEGYLVGTLKHISEQQVQVCQRGWFEEGGDDNGVVCSISYDFVTAHIHPFVMQHSLR